jgi:hypothetical protein
MFTVPECACFKLPVSIDLSICLKQLKNCWMNSYKLCNWTILLLKKSRHLTCILAPCLCTSMLFSGTRIQTTWSTRCIEQQMHHNSYTRWRLPKLTHPLSPLLIHLISEGWQQNSFILVTVLNQ